MITLRHPLRHAVVALVVGALSACGGGGDDRPRLAPFSQDTVPAGERIDVSTLNLFPNGASDSWTYDRISGSTITDTVTRNVVDGPDADGYVVLREADSSQSTDIVQRLSTDGLEQYDPLGAQGTWPGVFAALPTYLEYPTPLYPVDGERRSIRQGSFGADVDGDGLSDDFRAEIVQVFRGFEETTVFGQTVDAAHFHNILAFTTLASSTGESYTVTTTEHAYFVGNVGLIRADRSAQGSDGQVIVAPYTLAVRSATVGGFTYAAAQAQPQGAATERRAAVSLVKHRANAQWLIRAALGAARR